MFGIASFAQVAFSSLASGVVLCTAYDTNTWTEINPSPNIWTTVTGNNNTWLRKG